MYSARLNPPLRLVLTGKCNGTCCFCHHEGNYATYNNMSSQILDDCISAARELGITRINLTGGEPTLLSDLSTIISKIKHTLPTVELSLTTNGFCLGALTDTAFQLLDRINLSLISFKESVYLKYQKVNPNNPLLSLKKYSYKTTINIVVVDDNKTEILSIVDKSLQQGFAVDIMFDLISNDIKLQKEVLTLLTDEYGMFDICYASTPVMVSCKNSSVKLRVKVPGISRILVRQACVNCPYCDQCTEKVCALRVYPNGIVTPCLNGYITSDKGTVKERIKDLYPQLVIDKNDIYSFFIQ
jgi:cyclic pyranopterin phosphate synthase